jgi:hypothetical protein
MLLPLGIYRHYKGKHYVVLQIARHSETGERLVVYRCLYEDYSWWVRPLAMFTEEVESDGKILPRFVLEKSLEAEELTTYYLLSKKPSQ